MRLFNKDFSSSFSSPPRPQRGDYAGTPRAPAKGSALCAPAFLAAGIDVLTAGHEGSVLIEIDELVSLNVDEHIRLAVMIEVLKTERHWREILAWS